MRSAGTTTVAMLKSVAESYANGNVTVTEYYADYKFTIAFVSTRGIPAQMDKLKAAVEKLSLRILRLSMCIHTLLMAR